MRGLSCKAKGILKYFHFLNCLKIRTIEVFKLFVLVRRKGPEEEFLRHEDLHRRATAGDRWRGGACEDPTELYGSFH